MTIDQPFRLAGTPACGQRHQWCPRDAGWHEGVWGTELIRIRQTAAGLEFTGASDEQAERQWLHRHSRLDDDVDSIHSELAGRDPVLAGLLERSGLNEQRQQYRRSH